MKRHEEELPATWGTGLGIGAMVAVAVFLGVSWGLWHIPYPFQDIPNYGLNLKYWAAMMLAPVMPLQEWTIWAGQYRHYLEAMSAGLSPLWITGRFYLGLAAGIGTGLWLAYLMGCPVSAIRHIKGRRCVDGAPATRLLKRLSRNECRKSGVGIALYPDFGWSLSTDRETRHTLIVGSVGGGKTAIIIPLVQAALNRGDRMVVYDSKGDFTAWLPNMVLLAPWDKRSAAWDIGVDCADRQDAREVAARLIPEGNDPLWHTAARQILTAVLIQLQEVGRSKGVRVVLGAQDLEQVKALYGDHTVNSWSSMMGTQIIVRVNPGETANGISKQVIGYQTIDRITIREGKRQPPVRENVLVMEPSELESALGPVNGAVRAMLLGYGDVFILDWPFVSVESVRDPSKPAAWLTSPVSGPLPRPDQAPDSPPRW